MTIWAFKNRSGAWVEMSGPITLPDAGRQAAALVSAEGVVYGYGAIPDDMNVGEGHSWAEALSSDQRTSFGVEEVSVSARPTDVLVLGYHVADQDGSPALVWDTQPLPPPQAPRTVSRMQAKLALNAAGLLDDVEAAVAAASRSVQIYWAEVSEIHRDHPILLEMTSAMGWTETQLDDLFLAAAAIV